jgi:bifunctional UDP-N-acetylglucosamine pyrophosphorylase/glucosamine-1-phosphate N-acetyltransferase
MINKVVVAVAGTGTRMLELSKDKPKHLICVLDRPFLAYLLDNLFYAGYRDIILVVGYKGDMIQAFKDAYVPPVPGEYRIEVVSQYDLLGTKEQGTYGTACPLMCVKDSIHEPFIFLYGDNLYSVKDLKAMNVNDGYTYVAGMYNDAPEKYGVFICDEEGFLKEIIEKPKEFAGNIINTGPFTFTPEVFEKLPLIEKSPRGEYEITDVISLLAKEKKVKVKKIEDYWIDFGKPEDVEKLAQFITDGHITKI